MHRGCELLLCQKQRGCEKQTCAFCAPVLLNYQAIFELSDVPWDVAASCEPSRIRRAAAARASAAASCATRGRPRAVSRGSRGSPNWNTSPARHQVGDVHKPLLRGDSTRTSFSIPKPGTLCVTEILLFPLGSLQTHQSKDKLPSP